MHRVTGHRQITHRQLRQLDHRLRCKPLWMRARKQSELHQHRQPVLRALDDRLGVLAGEQHLPRVAIHAQ